MNTSKCSFGMCSVITSNKIETSTFATVISNLSVEPTRRPYRQTKKQSAHFDERYTHTKALAILFCSEFFEHFEKKIRLQQHFIDIFFIFCQCF